MESYSDTGLWKCIGTDLPFLVLWILQGLEFITGWVWETPKNNVKGRDDLKFTEILDWPEDPWRKNQIVVNIGLKEKGKRFKLCKTSEQRKWI